MSSPGTVDDAVERARTLLRLRRPDEAEREVRGALAREPQHPGAHAILALALRSLGRYAEALAEANESVRLAPDTWFPHYTAGHVLHAAGRHREALPAAWAALRIDPDQAGGWELTARIHLRLSEWWPAAQAAQRGIALTPEDSDLASLLALALSQLAGSAGAMAQAAEAVRLGPEEPLAHLAYGCTALHAGDAATAARSFREVLRLDPGMAQAREWLVVALKERNPLYRRLFRTLQGLLDKQRLWPPLLVVLLGMVVIGYWAFRAMDAVLTLRLARDSHHRLLLRAREIRAARLSAVALATGPVTLIAGTALARPALASAGVALTVLVLPIQETNGIKAPRGRLILGTWTALLALATAAIAAASLPFPAIGPVGIAPALASLATIWLRGLVEQRTGRQH